MECVVSAYGERADKVRGSYNRRTLHHDPRPQDRRGSSLAGLRHGYIKSTTPANRARRNLSCLATVYYVYVYIYVYTYIWHTHDIKAFTYEDTVTRVSQNKMSNYREDGGGSVRFDLCGMHYAISKSINMIYEIY